MLKSVCLSIISIVLFASTVLNAQSSKIKKAFELSEQGKVLYGEKKYNEAKSFFEQSNRIEADSKSFYYIAMCLEKLNIEHCGDRISSWESFLDSCKLPKANLTVCQEKAKLNANKKLEELKSRCVNQQTQVLEKHTVIEQNSDKNTSLSLTNSQTKSVAPTHEIANLDNIGNLKMNASFFCRYKQINQNSENQEKIYEEGKICNGAIFKENDQVSFAVEPLQDAYFYMLLFNESGQVQVLWPETDLDDNLLKSNQKYLFPSHADDDGWWDVDGVKNVTETILLIMSKNRITDLESKRGKEMQYDTHSEKLNFVVDTNKTRSLTNVTTEMLKKNITIGISELVEGSSERVITKFFFKHE